MSDDLYDSLEDECSDNRGSSNSLDLLQTKLMSVKKVSKSESINGLNSSCSGKHASKEMDFSSSNKAVAVNSRHRNNFLPTIKSKNPMPGLQELFNHSTDYDTLAKKGLLLNRDGSFTKSASDTEELPFITREYKNLVFQKRKTYNSKKPNSVAKALQTKACNEKETSYGDYSKPTSGKRCAETSQKKKEYFEEIIINFDKNSAMNLTDSMKRELLQNNQKSRQRSLEKTNAGQNAKLCFSETRTLKDRFLERTETKDLNIFSKQMPQFVQNNQKQRLTYFERHQLRNGYNPLFLRPGIKKITSDTTRSNFGDSMTGKLSDVSSRVLSVEDLTDSEGEEKFYKEIIEKEKNRTVKARHSVVTLSSGENDRVIGSGSLKDLGKLRGTNRSSYKQTLKPLSIDIRHDGERSHKKCSHYCTKDPSPKMSKTELALKGKTYGYMANARNIFKFKFRTEEKASGREDFSVKFNELSFGHKQASEMALNGIKKSLPSLNLAKKVRSGLERSSGRRVNGVDPRKAEDYTVKEGENSFYLPHVSSSEHKGCKVKSKNIMRISSCLYYPGNKTEEQITVH